MTFQPGHKANTGRKRPQWVKDKIGNSHIGITHTKATKKKLSKFRKGKCFITDTQKKEISRKLKGRTPWNKGLPKESHPMFGRKHSPESIEKNRIANSGKNSWNWQGGKSFEKYTTDWTKTLRRSIRERDHYRCRICGETQEDRVFPVHHIDYDKKNSSPSNLITLCNSCHTKTSFNRKYWKQYFRNETTIL